MHRQMIINQDDKIICIFEKKFINGINTHDSMNCSMNQFSELAKFYYILINNDWLNISSFMCLKEVCFYHKKYTDWIDDFSN